METETDTTLVTLQDAERAVQEKLPEAVGVRALIQAAQTALETATTPQDLKEIADKAVAIETYLRRRNGLLRDANEIAAVRLEAERKLGKLLRDQVKPGSHRATLPEGITRNKSSQIQALAEIDEHRFDSIIRELLESTEELTTSAVLRRAKANGSCPVEGQESRHRDGQERRSSWKREAPVSDEDTMPDYEVDVSEYGITAVQIKEAFPDLAEAFSHLDDDALVLAISFRAGAEE